MRVQSGSKAANCGVGVDLSSRDDVGAIGAAGGEGAVDTGGDGERLTAGDVDDRAICQPLTIIRAAGFSMWKRDSATMATLKMCR